MKRVAGVVGMVMIGPMSAVIGWGHPSSPSAPPPTPKISYDTDLFRENKKVLFSNLELLYWSVNEGALDYALRMNQPAWGDPTEGIGDYKEIDFGWNPGFRLNFGYFNAPHYWDALLQWTYFRGTGHDKTHAPLKTGQFLNGTWPHPAFNPAKKVPLAKAKSSIEMNLHLLEALFTRRFHPNPHLRMRLYGGPTLGWLSQHWKTHYQDVAGQTAEIQSRWKFTGAGIRAGYLVDWFLGKGGFYFTGLVSAAVYAGSYHNRSQQFASDTDEGQFNTLRPLRDIHMHAVRLVPHVQLLAGPSWQQAFTHYRTEVFIGYELNFWTNLHEVYRTSTTAPQQAKQTFINTSVLGIQGVTLRWNLDF